MAAYQGAIRSDASNLEARWKLVRALRFKAVYVARGNDAKRDTLTLARDASSEAVARIKRRSWRRA